MVGSLLLETIYTFVIVACCAVIQKHARCLSDLSGHQGIRCFQKAFSYWGLGFLIRYLYILGINNPTFYGASNNSILIIISIFFEYLISLGGFFLVYSLIWRQMDQVSPSFAARYRMLALHVLAIAIALADVSLGTFHFLFVVQILALGYAALLAYDHWKKNQEKSVKNTFASLYLIALIAALIGYIINYVAQFLISNYPSIVIITYILTASIFLIMLFGVLRIVHSGSYCDRCCPAFNKKQNGKKTRKA